MPRDEVHADSWGHDHASGAHADPHRLGQRRQEVCETARPHPVAQVRSVAALDEQRVRRPDERHPALRIEAGQRGELQHSHGLPTQSDGRRAGLLAADAAPRLARTGPGVPVQRGRDAEGVALRDRLAQQVDERRMDARVPDAGGREKKFQGAPSVAVKAWFLSDRLRRRDKIIGARSIAITSNHT